MLELKGVSLSFNKGTVNEKQALRDINLTVNDGDFITVIGGNGAGKSTLLNILGLLDNPTSGSMRFMISVTLWLRSAALMFR